MTVRNLDEGTLERLRQRARRHHRSLEAEVRAILDGAAHPDRAELVRQANRLHAALVGRYEGNVTAEIRADRDR